jgi:hypothetical protein
MAGFGQSCYCLIDDQQFQCHETNWDEIFAIPGITDFSLLGNDSDESIRTCKILLTILGPKFETLLEGSEVRLDYPLSVVKTINDLALTGRPKFDDLNVEPLLQAAREYNLLGIKKFGSHFLMSRMNAGNVLQIYQLSEEFLCSHMNQKVEKYILSNFQDLVEHPEFLHNCKAEWILEWLKNDELNAPEETIFLFLVSWAQINAHAEAFKNLAKHIRFHLLKRDFLQSDVKPCTLLQGEPILEKTMKSFASNSYAAHLLRFRYKNIRLPFELVFSVGGFGTHSLSTIEVFDVRSKRWFRIDKCFHTLSYHGVVIHDNELMTFGGFGDEGLGSGPGFISDTLRFNLLEKTWRKKSCMHTPRCYISVAKLGANIYCLGGFDGNMRLNSVEIYNSEDNSWSLAPPMKSIRSDACAVAYDNKIFVIGGYDGTEVLRSTEIYDTAREEWVLGPRLNVSRSGLKAVILNDKLYAIGGFNGEDRLRSVEILDLSNPNAVWTLSNSELITPRSNFGAAVVDKNILVAGGYNGSGVTAESEIFCPKTNTWSQTSPLTEKKSALVLVTVEDLPNRRQYLPYWKFKS